MFKAAFRLQLSTVGLKLCIVCMFSLYNVYIRPNYVTKEVGEITGISQLKVI